MKKCYRKRGVIGLLAFLAATGIVCGGIYAVGTFSARVELRKGAGTIKRGEARVPIVLGAAPQSLRVGDTLALPKGSAARITFSGKNAVEIEGKSCVVLERLRFSPQKRAVAVGLSLQAGKIEPSIYEPAKEEIKKGKAWKYDFQVAVGKGVVSGASFVGEIVRQTEKRYKVDARAGRPIVQHGAVLVRLRSAVTVDEGPPFVVTASGRNETAIVAAYVGSVVFVLQPGQSVQIEWTGDEVRLMNLSPTQTLCACEWDGVPLVEIKPGEQWSFGIVETEIGRERALAHIGQITGLIRETMPEALLPPPVEVPAQIIERPGVRREGQGGLVSPAE